MSKTKTVDQVKAEFASNGKTFSQWAQENNFSKFDVYKVLNGSLKGRRGTAHDIAVALGIKTPAAQRAA